MKLQVSLHGVLNVLVKRVVFLAFVKFLSRLMGLVERFGGVQPNTMTGSTSPPLFECRIESSSVMASHVSDEGRLKETRNLKNTLNEGVYLSIGGTLATEIVASVLLEELLSYSRRLSERLLRGAFQVDIWTEFELGFVIQSFLKNEKKALARTSRIDLTALLPLSHHFVALIPVNVTSPFSQRHITTQNLWTLGNPKTVKLRKGSSHSILVKFTSNWILTSFYNVDNIVITQRLSQIHGTSIKGNKFILDHLQLIQVRTTHDRDGA